MTNVTVDSEKRFELKPQSACQESMFYQLVIFALHNKKWWMLPFILVVCALSAFVVVASSGAAPLIYTLF